MEQAGEDDRERFVGTWALRQYRLEKDGHAEEPLGPKPVGIIIYDAAGNMSCQLANPDAPDLPPGDEDSDGWRSKISYTSFSSYFGRWTIEPGHRVVHHHVTGALMPGWVDTVVSRDYRFDGADRLTLSAGMADGLLAILRWERVG